LSWNQLHSLDLPSQFSKSVMACLQQLYSQHASFDSIDADRPIVRRNHLRIHACPSKCSRNILDPTHVPCISCPDYRGSNCIEAPRGHVREHLGTARNRRCCASSNVHQSRGIPRLALCKCCKIGISLIEGGSAMAWSSTVIFWACRNRDCCRPDQSRQTHAVPTSDRLARCELETQDAVSYSNPESERSRNAHRRRPQTHG